ncbi:PepSY domain-containing protein [uncultured Shewanella sp.]|uniref:PepSY-associated TM helix domain-containing protein n=1 Tax=uncultured Shewanella sp. TaxID=173975 RepID=UPI002619DB36|nr:PepSY-associated TM helix domain-containing protein [uncultured Shewanella sp.]
MKVRSDILRIYQSIHIWTGIITGLVLFIGFYAGSLTMFKSAIDRWIAPPNQVLAPISQDKTQQLVDTVLHNMPTSQQGFTLFLNAKELNQSPLIWYDKPQDRELSLNTTQWHATLNEQDKLVTQQVTPSALAELIDMLHRTAGIPGMAGHEQVGVLVLGVAAVLYFIALVSGIIFLLPTLTKTFLALRKGKSTSRFWLDSHNILGLTSLPFHIVISVTVVVFAFHDVLYGGLQAIVYDDKPLFTRPESTLSAPATIDNLLTVEELLEKAKAIAPEFTVTNMVFSNLQGQWPSVRLGVYNPEHIMRGPITDYLFFNPYSGILLNSTLQPGSEGIWNRIVASFFALHFGSYGGDLVRWLYFFLGLGGAFLFYSGNLLWLEKRRVKLKKDRPAQPQSASCYSIASATVGICIGSIAAVLFTMVIGKWLYLHVSNINHYYYPLYYSIFISLVCWAFWRGAARSAIELLYLTAIAAFAIPVTSVIAWFDIFPIWSSQSMATLGVDMTALIAGVIMLLLAQKAKFRALNGAPDSVWSFQSYQVRLASKKIQVKLDDSEDKVISG